MRTPIIAGNWKMNYGPTEAEEFVAGILPGLHEIHEVERVLCPPAISLTTVYGAIVGSEVKLGAQNMFYEPKGAYTGEIAPPMLQGLCEYVILGRRCLAGANGPDWLIGHDDLSSALSQ